MSTRSLVVIPANETFNHLRVTTMKNDAIRGILDEARQTPSHWFHGMQVIDDHSDWPRYGYEVGSNGNPIPAPNAVSLAKAQYDKYENDRKQLSHVENEQTVGDLQEQIKQLQAAVNNMASESSKRVEQVKADAVAEDRAKRADIEAVTKAGKKGKSEET